MAQFKHVFGQWVVEGENDQSQPGYGYEIYNPGPNGEKRFYRAFPGSYMEPLIEPEPVLAFQVPDNFVYIDANGGEVKPNQKISGIICQNGPRFSITNAQNKGVLVAPNSDGSIQIDDQTWWIATLFMKDRNRIRNYDAFLVRERRDRVRVLELGDLDLF